MAKKSQARTNAGSTKQTGTPSQRTKDTNNKSVSKSPPTFPTLTSKDDVTCTTLLDDQILLLDVCVARSLLYRLLSRLTEEYIHMFLQNMFTYEECRQFVKFIDGLPLELTPPKKRGEADRLNRSYLTSYPRQALLNTPYFRSNLNNISRLCKRALLRPSTPST